MSAYLSAVLADNPAHYWRCADPSGRVLHDIGSNPKHLLAPTNNSELGYSGPISDGGSLILCGAGASNANSIIQLPNIVPMTIELWFWAVGVPTSFQDVFSWDDNAAPSFRLGLSSANQFNGVALGTNTGTISGVTFQAWHCAQLTIQAATSTLRVDGVSAGAVVGTYTASTHTFVLGQNGAGANLWAGAIAEVAVYAAALSATRLTAHFSAADNVSSVPIASGAGGFGGSGIGSGYDGVLQAILSSVRRTYPTT